MKMKWYFGALIIAFTLLGVYQNRVSEPNQEIALKFSDVNITSDDAKNTIAFVKEQLEAIGINNVRVKELKNGQFKIAYYSTSDVASIKVILSKDKNIEIGFTPNIEDENPTQLPSNKKSKTYKLDVYEIHKSSDSDSGLDGNCILTINQDKDRFYNPNVVFSTKDIDLKDSNKIVKVAFKAYFNVEIAIDNTSGNIPEVRAGPSIRV